MMAKRGVGFPLIFRLAHGLKSLQAAGIDTPAPALDLRSWFSDTSISQKVLIVVQITGARSGSLARSHIVDVRDGYHQTSTKRT
jgi:hypothetical protein